MDRLSNLPSSIIESILCLVPIQEAGRTSILSREWRYRWTKIPNLVFIEDTFQVSTVDGAESSILDQTHEQRIKRQTMDKKSKLIYAICQVLLIHDGPINEFTLSLCLSRKHVKIDPILTYLSRKTRGSLQEERWCELVKEVADDLLLKSFSFLVSSIRTSLASR
ncbi:F-box/FBD/LRR-repeat protein-like protein [Tanacetum coccineum]